MYHNIKILIIPILSMLICMISSENIHANPVQVSDLGAYPFYQRICDTNDQASKLGLKMEMNQLLPVGQLNPDSSYDAYCAILGPHGHSTLLTLFANKAGCVSKITICTRNEDSVSAQFFGFSLGHILIALGLDESEYQNILNSNSLRDIIEQQRGYTDIWVNSINRRIVLEYYIDGDLQGFRITAQDS